MKEQIDQIISDVFGKSTDITTAIWEQSKKDDGINRIYTMQYVTGEKGSIIWYKIIVPFKENKKELKGSTFYRLYDLDCSYRTTIYNNLSDLKNRLIDIKDNPKFGPMLLSLSKFSEKPIEFINSNLRDKGQTWISVLNVDFNPKWKVIPCKRFNINFDIFLSSQINLTVNISKTSNMLWSLRFHNIVLDEKVTIDNIEDISSVIADFIIENIKIG